MELKHKVGYKQDGNFNIQIRRNGVPVGDPHKIFDFTATVTGELKVKAKVTVMCCKCKGSRLKRVELTGGEASVKATLELKNFINETIKKQTRSLPPIEGKVPGFNPSGVIYNNDSPCS